jgi:hypothetical protein
MRVEGKTHEVLHQLETNGVDLPPSVKKDLVERRRLQEGLEAVEGRLEMWVQEVAAISKSARGRPCGYARVITVPDSVVANAPPRSADTGEAVLAAMRQLGAECMPAGIASVLRLWGRSVKPSGVRGWLGKFVKAGSVEHVRYGIYRLADGNGAAASDD